MLWRKFPMLKSRITEYVAEIYLLARLLLSSYQPKMIAALKRWSPDSGQGLSRPPTLICGVISAKNVFNPKSHQWMHLFWVYKNYVGIPGNQHFAGNMVIRHVTKRFSQSFRKKHFAKLLENYPWYHFLNVFLVSAFYANSNRTDESLRAGNGPTRRQWDLETVSSCSHRKVISLWEWVEEKISFGVCACEYQTGWRRVEYVTGLIRCTVWSTCVQVTNKCVPQHNEHIVN